MKTVYSSGSVETIVNEISAKLSNCIFIIYCSDDQNFEEISKGLRNALSKVQMIGTTGHMFNKSEISSTGMMAIGFMADEIEVFVGSIRRIDTCPIEYVPGLIWSVDTIGKKYKNNICIELTTGSEEKLVSTMKIALETVNMPLIGGTAGNVMEGGQKKVSCNGKVLTNAAVYAVIGSKCGKIEIYKENLFHIRPKMHLATKVSDHGRKLMELDNCNAVDVYERELGYRQSDLQESMLKHPFCRVVGEEHYIAAIKEFNGDKSISMYKNIQKSDMLSLTDMIEDYQGFILNNMNRIASEHKIVGMLTFNCSLRYLFFEKEGYTSEYARLLEKTAKGCHFGIVTDGEQYMTQHINQSMVAVIFTKD